MTKKEETKISKLLSFILRHDPNSIGLELNGEGWASVEQLLAKLKKHNHEISSDQLKFVVDHNSKKRFTFNHDQSLIRASQGHSVNIDIGLSPTKPPQFLYHGTASKNKNTILENGISKMNRQHVHLSQDIDTAIKVGQRHGKPIVFKILALEMFNQGFDFFLADNNVWLTNQVPQKFITQ